MKQKVLILLILIPLGLLTKIYTGPGSKIINNHLGGVIYVVFFIFLTALVFPQTRAIKIALLVFIVTCSLEFTQMIQTDFLNRLREYFVVYALIGSSFNLMDMPFYGVGGGIGWWGLKMINKKNKNVQPNHIQTNNKQKNPRASARSVSSAFQ